MCGGGLFGGGPDLPPASDPKAERDAAQADATTKANQSTAAAKKLRQQQSLLASGGIAQGDQLQTSSVLAQGKAKLGA
jgi:hypothetical protein